MQDQKKTGSSEMNNQETNGNPMGMDAFEEEEFVRTLMVCDACGEKQIWRWDSSRYVCRCPKCHKTGKFRSMTKEEAEKFLAAYEK